MHSPNLCAKFELVTNKKFSVRISDYEFIRGKAKELQYILEQNNIRCYYYQFMSGEDLWYYKGIFEMQGNKDDSDVKEIFNHCKNNICLTLERSKMTYCSRAANAPHIQHFNEKDGDCCIIEVAPDLGNRIMDYVNNKHFMEACRYCYGTNESKKCHPAEQIQ